MSMTDPVADFLTHIRNATMRRHATVESPSSTFKMAIASVLKKEGFIENWEVSKSEQGHARIRVDLKYDEQGGSIIRGIKRVSRPGLRVYVQKREIPRVFNGLGIAILSTPKGIMAGQQAWRQKTGGEVLCYVW